MDFLVPLLVVDLLVFGPVTAWLAKQRGRSMGEGFILGALLGLIGLILIGLSPAATRPMQTCPRCAEKVLAAASVCRYCGAQLTPDLTPATQPHLSRLSWILLILLAVAIILAVLQVQANGSSLTGY
jgi:hypothetical protein